MKTKGSHKGILPQSSESPGERHVCTEDEAAHLKVCPPNDFTRIRAGQETVQIL